VVCGKVFLTRAKNPRKTCSEECRRIRYSHTMRDTNIRRRGILSARMKADNPMKKPGVKERAMARLKEIGHKPKIQGGNGRGPTIPQKMLNDILGWEMEAVIPTSKPHGLGWPHAYKVDIASREHMVAVEVDGSSHCSLERRAQDRKKDEFLNGLGFKVLRFKNREILKNPEGCAARAWSLTLK
jgi:hypothetical protein